MWEGGVRVLSMVRWPDGGVPAGVENDAFLTSLEIFPSLASACSADLPEGVKIDGFDWWESAARRDRKSALGDVLEAP